MRITQKDLENLATRLNKTTNSPEQEYTRDKDGKLRANVGNYHIDYAYGGTALHRMSNEHGGVNDIFGGHFPKRELYYRIHAYLSGLFDAMENN